MMAVLLMFFSLLGLVLSAPFSFNFSNFSQNLSDKQYFEMMRKIQPESPNVNRKPAVEIPMGVSAQNRK